MKKRGFALSAESLKRCVLTVLSAVLLSFSACGGNALSVVLRDNDKSSGVYGGGEYTDDFEIYEGFSVNYLDVGNGDAIFIRFADGKTMLIDCGAKSDLNLKTVKRYLDAYAKNGLDYLVLTHPDGDHTGNAAEIAENYAIGRAYIPYLLQPENFDPYCHAYNAIKEKAATGETEIVYSALGKTVCGEDYYAVFLSPNDKDADDSAYTDVNSSAEPNSDDINDVSPIIYLDYKGVRFIFTGDAGFSQEKVALNNVDVGLVDRFVTAKGKSEINLTDVDFLKVSHHGSDKASGDEFLQRITPVNAVISVSGSNNYGHPDGSVLSRIYAANENCNVYLTSEYGTVSVLVDGNGKASVKTAETAKTS